MSKVLRIFKSMGCCTFRVAVLLLFGLGLVLPKAALCQSVIGQEYEVKAGFVYNFINYVTWPEGVFSADSDTLTLCLISKNPASDVLYRLNGKSIKGKKIEVIAYEGVSSVTQSHILFFAIQDETVIQKILHLGNGLGILSIGEVDGFVRLGGVINFFVESDRLRFKINIDAAKREGLKMSSQLLGSAQIFREEQE